MVAAPPSVLISLLPRFYFARVRTRRLSEVRKAWPDGIRDVIGGVSSGMSVQRAVENLARSGPAPLREAFGRFPMLARTLGVMPALESIKEDLADPTSDRVIEVLMIAHERGGVLIPEILRDLADSTSMDLAATEEEQTEALEQRINARVVFMLPWLVLVALTFRPGPFRAFYSLSCRDGGGGDRGGAVAPWNRSYLSAVPSPGGAACAHRLGWRGGSMVGPGESDRGPAHVDHGHGGDALVFPAAQTPEQQGASLCRGGRFAGGGSDPGVLFGRTSGFAPVRLFGPMILAAAHAVGRIADRMGEEQLILRLRQARFYPGMEDRDRVASYRLAVLGTAVMFVGMGAGMTLVLRQSTLVVLAASVGGGLMGSLRVRARLDRAVEQRRSIMKIEISTINQLLAIRVRSGSGVMYAVGEITARGRGEVIGELGVALRMHRSGMSAAGAFRRMAEITPESYCARTYKLLASSEEMGVDFGGRSSSLGRRRPPGTPGSAPAVRHQKALGDADPHHRNSGACHAAVRGGAPSTTDSGLEVTRL